MKKLTLITLLSCSFISLPALADEKDNRIQALEAQMQVMMQELQSLKAERANERRQQVMLEQKVQSLQAQQAANLQPAAGDGDGDDVEISMSSPTPKFKKGEFEFQPFGRIHLDAAHFEDDARDHPSGAEFRRARLGAKGKIAKDFGYKLEVDFANEGVNFKDVYVNYTGIDGAEIKAGSFKPPQGLEDLTSSNYTTFIERNSASSAFGTGEVIGAQVSGHGEGWTLTGGIFNDDEGRTSADDEAFNVTARATLAPINDEDTTLHLGASASHRKPDNGSKTFDFDAKAENALQSTDSVSAVMTMADNAQIYGAEAAFIHGPFAAQGEYYRADVDNINMADTDFNGAYAQMSWILTGEHKPYDAKAGKMGRVVPDRPLDPSKGDWGAVEIAGRYSHLDLTDGPISGGEMDNWTLGLNWYLTKHFRLMGNYIFVNTDNSAVTPDDDPQILLLRTQADF